MAGSGLVGDRREEEEGDAALGVGDDGLVEVFHEEIGAGAHGGPDLAQRAFGVWPREQLDVQLPRCGIFRNILHKAFQSDLRGT